MYEYFQIDLNDVSFEWDDDNEAGKGQVRTWRR